MMKAIDENETAPDQQKFDGSNACLEDPGDFPAPVQGNNAKTLNT
jgi:hypothetical protein